MKGCLITSPGTDPFANLALEEYLLNYCEDTARIILYFWQNENTVVVGRNQNAYTECNTGYVTAAGIRVARRITGGGAVFHDLGNLNYSLFLPKHLYNPRYAEKMLVKALNGLGIKASLSGRNDICLAGGKISGNACYIGRKAVLCHGTLLYKTDIKKMASALNVAPAKLAKRGIVSVKSRVDDIASHYPAVTLSDLTNAVQKEVAAVYNLSGFAPLSVGEKDFAPLQEKYNSRKWNWERIKDYSLSSEKNFAWGNVRLSLLYAGNDLKDIEISSDALNADFVEDVKLALRNVTSDPNGESPVSFLDDYALKHEDDRRAVNDIKNMIAELINGERGE